MLEILRNLQRRGGRTVLTAFGVAIGLFAVTVMGALSEQFGDTIERAERYVGGRIDVQARGTSEQLGERTLAQLRNLADVAVVIPVASGSLDEGASAPQFANASLFGVPPDQTELALGGPPLAEGRPLDRADTAAAVIGHDVARRGNLRAGSAITVRGRRLQVVGALARTSTFLDQIVVTPIETARRALAQPTLISSILVVPRDLAQAERLAATIRRDVPAVQVRSPEESRQEARAGLILFNLIVLTGAVLAAVVGGLSVINTMLVSVGERIREIGLKKAVGASDRAIVGEFLGEAIMIGLIGGLGGLAAGWLATQGLNALTGEQATLFLLTPRLALSSLAFALALGALAGVYPAWRAARLTPVSALRAP